MPYKYVVLTRLFAEDTWVQGIQILPDNPRVVHHCNMAYIRLGEKFKIANFLTGQVPGGEPMTLATSGRSAVAEIDRARPAGNMRTVEQYLGEQARGMELYAALLGIFGAAAGLLAALGIYGVMAYTVAQRSREIGLRFALGAPAARVRGMVLRQVFRMAVIGVVLGGIAARPSRPIAPARADASPAA